MNGSKTTFLSSQVSSIIVDRLKNPAGFQPTGFFLFSIPEIGIFRDAFQMQGFVGKREDADSGGADGHFRGGGVADGDEPAVGADLRLNGHIREIHVNVLIGPQLRNLRQNGLDLRVPEDHRIGDLPEEAVLLVWRILMLEHDRDLIIVPHAGA